MEKGNRKPARILLWSAIGVVCLLAAAVGIMRVASQPGGDAYAKEEKEQYSPKQDGVI